MQIDSPASCTSATASTAIATSGMPAVGVAAPDRQALHPQGQAPQVSGPGTVPPADVQMTTVGPPASVRAAAQLDTFVRVAKLKSPALADIAAMVRHHFKVQIAVSFEANARSTAFKTTDGNARVLIATHDSPTLPAQQVTLVRLLAEMAMAPRFESLRTALEGSQFQRLGSMSSYEARWVTHDLKCSPLAARFAGAGLRLTIERHRMVLSAVGQLQLAGVLPWRHESIDALTSKFSRPGWDDASIEIAREFVQHFPGEQVAAPSR